MLADYSSLKLRHRRYVARCTIYILAVSSLPFLRVETGLGGADDDDHLELSSILQTSWLKCRGCLLFARLTLESRQGWMDVLELAIALVLAIAKTCASHGI
jgi:hypothetical protein